MYALIAIKVDQAQLPGNFLGVNIENVDLALENALQLHFGLWRRNLELLLALQSATSSRDRCNFLRTAKDHQHQRRSD